MLLHENELGWRWHKCMFGFAIRRAHPPLRSRLAQVGPALITLLLALAIWLGRDRVMWYTLCTGAVLLLAVWLFGTDRVKRAAWPAVSGVVIFLGLLAGDRIGIDTALSTIPLSLLVGLWCFRPTVLYANTRQRVLGDLGYQVPFARMSIETNQDQETGRYQVYLKDAQPLWETATQAGMWKCLVWESSTEAEVSAIAEEFRASGIGTPDPHMQLQVVKADKRLRLLAYGGHLLSVIALIAIIAWMARSVRKANRRDDPEVMLRLAQSVIAFVFLSILPLATYLWRLGRLSVRCRQMPPPGMRIIEDMRVIEGNKAVTRGRRMTKIGFVLIVIGLIGGLYVP